MACCFRAAKSAKGGEEPGRAEWPEEAAHVHWEAKKHQREQLQAWHSTQGKLDEELAPKPEAGSTGARLERRAAHSGYGDRGGMVEMGDNELYG